jgi:DNA-binding NarL/FixJ family response regulator
MPSPRLPHIVIVDDHAVFRQIAREVFEERGYAVLGEADCGAAAKTLVERCLPDLAVVDVRLGDECGFDVAAELTRSHPSLSVLLTSSDPDAGDPARVARSGARGFVPKSTLGTVDFSAYWRRAEAARGRDAALRLISWRHGAPRPLLA